MQLFSFLSIFPSLGSYTFANIPVDFVWIFRWLNWFKYWVTSKTSSSVLFVDTTHLPLIDHLETEYKEYKCIGSRIA